MLAGGPPAFESWGRDPWIWRRSHRAHRGAKIKTSAGVAPLCKSQVSPLRARAAAHRRRPCNTRASAASFDRRSRACAAAKSWLNWRTVCAFHSTNQVDCHGQCSSSPRSWRVKGGKKVSMTLRVAGGRACVGSLAARTVARDWQPHYAHGQAFSQVMIAAGASLSGSCACRPGALRARRCDGLL